MQKVSKTDKRGLSIKKWKYWLNTWFIHSFHDKIQFKRLFNITFFRMIQLKKIFNNLFSQKIQFKNWFKNFNLDWSNSIKFCFTYFTRKVPDIFNKMVTNEKMFPTRVHQSLFPRLRSKLHHWPGLTNAPLFSESTNKAHKAIEKQQVR